ncbi:OmpA family protein [Aquimarina sp. ERC-38]|uniref:OmpA family protein n=1 Tax=Aquimarina sp. ERC-38 TaxID=2949996 RepID=UPI002247C924|nr:OmpA family protein [Aquimarina sp. ERC-38]UZO80273.1 OmpA family protein [Aquimarina sp. ERC-38]
MKKLLLFIAIIAFSSHLTAQKKSRADRFFEIRDYKNAALSYEEELNQKGYEKHILENISVAYYNTFQFKNAYRYLKILTAGKFYAKDKSYDNQYNFMMFQVLSALGKYEKAIDFLATYRKNSGVTNFLKMEAIEEIEAFKLKDDDYVIEEAGFNTEYSEFGAVKMDSLLYFTSDRPMGKLLGKNYKWTHRPFLNILKGKIDDNNVVSDIESISDEINTPLHEGTFCFALNNNAVYFSKSYEKDGKKKFDSLGNNPVHLYRSLKVDGNWEKPEALPFNDLQYSTEHPAISSDGTTLYFSSNRPGGYGDFDIYAVQINEDGTYGEPHNLGETINTSNREQFPFISKIGHLFFASNGHLGLGMMDNFAAEFKDGKLQKPINLGTPINSSYDDFGISYHEATKGYFSSNRKSKNNDDIYQFEQVGEIFPKPYQVTLEIKDFATDSLIKNAYTELIIGEESIVKDSLVTGSTQITVLPGKYKWSGNAKNYSEKQKQLVVKEKQNQTYTLFLEEDKTILDSTKLNTANGQLLTATEGNQKPKLTGEALKKKLLEDVEGPPVVEKNGRLFFELPPIYFDYDKWNIRADSKKVLDDFAKKLDKYNTVYITIASHTDSRGTVDYNQELSEKRAESTRNYLALEGYVNARRMKFAGYGESQPLINCDSNDCGEKEHQLNRRSEFEIVKY